MSDTFTTKYKKPYDAAYRRARYEKDREKILAWQREYDAAHKEHRAALARARYVRKCDRKRAQEQQAAENRQVKTDAEIILRLAAGGGFIEGEK
jgi:hypothetical protein